MQRLSEINISKVRPRHLLLGTAITCASAYGARKVLECTFPKIYRTLLGSRNPEKVGNSVSIWSTPEDSNSKRKTASPSVNYEFLKQLYKLIKVILPGFFTKEFGLLSVHSAALIARTFLSIYVAALDGRLARCIVEKDSTQFLLFLMKWIAVSVPCSFINSLLRYLEQKLGLAFRNRLTEYSYKLYFDKQTYYKIGNLDSRLTNPDECLTEDVRLFSLSVAHLYSHVTKPLLDVIVICFTLKKLAVKRGSSWLVPLALGTLVTFVTSEILKGFSPRFGKLVADESQKRGYLRYIQSRIITNSEEIAFYGGHKVPYHYYR